MSRFALLMAAAATIAAQNSKLDKEAAIGREMMADIERQYGAVADPTVNAYVDVIARKLRAAARTDLPVTVSVFNTHDSLAGSFLGGQLFLSAGLLLRAQLEAQVAAVLAHELAHSIARHGSAGPITFTGVCNRYPQDRPLPLALKRASKGLEDEADALGREYLAKAGYDPRVMASAFEELRRPSLRPRPPAEPALEAIKARLR